MNNKEVDPENLGGLGDMLPADVLKMLNELLEQQHRTGHPNNGSKIEVVYVASGAQHVETQIIAYPHPLPKGREKGSGNLPEVLATNEAMALWEKVQRARYVDDNYQPTISRTQSALLADEIAERLVIKEKWKTFETLWNRRNMYRDYHDALNQRQSLLFRDRLRELLG